MSAQTLRIAIAQAPGTRLEQWREVLTLTGELVGEAAGQRADIVLLPECLWPAYLFATPDEYFQQRKHGLPAPSVFLDSLQNLARQHGVAICAGHISETGGTLFNTASLIAADGQLLGNYRKCFLWDHDYVLFKPGTAIEPIDTAWGPIGVMICADARLPEIPATLATRGARLILQPTAWVNCGGPDELWNPQPETLIPERAREFGMPIASCSKWGREMDTDFVGSSVICDATGNVLVQCGTRVTEVRVADVALATARRASISDEQRSRLLSTDAAVMPPASVPDMHVECVAAQHDSSIAVRLRPLPQAGDANSDNQSLTLTAPDETFHNLEGIRIGSIAATDTLSFAAARAAAIRGTHVLVVFGNDATERTVRGRATENRLFVIHVRNADVVCYAPTGHLVAPDAAGVFTLGAADAASREFAPRTNPFTQRRPSSYDF